jgi:hypothetical protein
MTENDVLISDTKISFLLKKLQKEATLQHSLQPME